MPSDPPPRQGRRPIARAHRPIGRATPTREWPSKTAQPTRTHCLRARVTLFFPAAQQFHSVNMSVNLNSTLEVTALATPDNSTGVGPLASGFEQRKQTRMDGTESRRRIRQRIEEQALVPMTPQAASAPSRRPTYDEVSQRIREMQKTIAELKSQVEGLRGGCAAGFARERQLEELLKRHNIPVPSKRR